MISNFYGEAKKIWDDVSASNQLTDTDKLALELEIHKKLLNIFQVGEFYHFIFNLREGNFDYVSPAIMDVLGYPTDTSTSFHLSQIHPEDQPYFLNFENKGREFFRGLSPDQIGKYKIRYDYRIRDAWGKYRRILHQLLIIEYDDQGNLFRSFGVHTDITHLKETGTPTLSFIGLEGEPSYINVEVENVFHPRKKVLSSRESDVLLMIAHGKTSIQISQDLHISKSTVDTHRKNLLKKTNSLNTSELISKAITEGWI